MTGGQPDPKAHERATAQLRADHQPRTLQREPRLSRADEQTITDAVHHREHTDQRTARASLAATTTDLTRQVQALRRAMTDSITTTRGERNLARRIAHDLEVLTGTLTVPSSRGVHLTGRE